MKKRGASGPAFESGSWLLESGPPSRMPGHGKRLRKNELVCWTWVLILGHYCKRIPAPVYVGRAQNEYGLVSGCF